MWYKLLALYFCANGWVHYRVHKRKKDVDWDVSLMMLLFGFPLFLVSIVLKRMDKL